MSDISAIHLNSVDALRSCAALWDDLWYSSDVTQPTARAELVAQWVERLGSPNAFQAIVLSHQKRFVAALPLLNRRRGAIVDSLDVPGNEWSSGGDLLASDCDTRQVCDRLISEMGKLPTPLFWFEALAIDASAWQCSVQAARRAGWDIDRHDRFASGWLDVPTHDADAVDPCSKNFRKQLRRARRQLAALGCLRLRIERPTDADQARRLLMDGLRIEHSGWKGRAASSVLSHRERASFYQAQAVQLSAWRQVALAFLDLDGQPIAFEYAWWAKQIHHSMKIAYDERFAQHSPGQLLVHELLQRFRTSHACQAIDLIGPLDATARRWRPRTRHISRLLLAPKGSFGRAVVFASRNVLPHLRTWRNQIRQFVPASTENRG